MKFAVGVANGIDVLWLTFLALGIGLGDECVTTTNTFFARGRGTCIRKGVRCQYRPGARSVALASLRGNSGRYCSGRQIAYRDGACFRCEEAADRRRTRQ